MLPERPARALSICPVAARALAEGARGSVRAEFPRSLYLTLGETWCCLGPPGLGAGPLNVLCEPWQAEVPVGAPARVAGGALRIGGAAAVVLAGAVPWRPPPAPAWDRAQAARGLAALAAALPPVLPAEGLARFLRAGLAWSPVAAAALPAVRHLAQDGACDADAARVTPLLGLGPGLTPSGDDFLGGAMIALSLAGRADRRDALWRALAPRLAGATGAISAAHLRAAAEGLGSAALHALLAAILAGGAETMAQELAAVAAIGHTSGWDALAGAVTVLRAAAGCEPPAFVEP